MASITPWAISTAPTAPVTFKVNADRPGQDLDGGHESAPIAVWLQDAFAFVWQSSDSHLWVKGYDPAGQPDGTFGVPDVATQFQPYALDDLSEKSHDAIATMSGGLGVLTVWLADTASGTTELHGHHVSAVDGPTGEFTIAAPGGDVTALGQAATSSYEIVNLVTNNTEEFGFYVAWTETTSTGTTAVAQRYVIPDPDGVGPAEEGRPEPVGDRIVLAENVGSNASIVGLHDGQVVLGYQDGSAYKVRIFAPQHNADGTAQFDADHHVVFNELASPVGGTTDAHLVKDLPAGATNAQLVTLSTDFMLVYAVGDEIHGQSFIDPALTPATTGLTWNADADVLLSATGGADFKVSPLDGNAGGVFLSWKDGSNVIHGRTFDPTGTLLAEQANMGTASGDYSITGLDTGLLMVATDNAVGTDAGDIFGSMFDTRTPGQFLEGARLGALPDFLVGTVGDDTMHGGARNDVLYGGAGTDTATFGGKLSDYTISADAATKTLFLFGPDAPKAGRADELHDVEKLQFQDITINTKPMLDPTHNGAPTAMADSYTMAAGSSALTVTAADGVLKHGTADSDPDGDPLFAVLGSTGPTKGSVTLNSDGSFAYRAGAAYDPLVGDSFTYKASDGGAQSAEVKVTITGGSAAANPGLNRTVTNAAGGSLSGNSTDDTLTGAAGRDTLLGNGGNDVLSGNAGDDLLNGGTGADTMTGGAGKDTFDFNTWEDSGTGAGSDVIIDFVQRTDKIDLRDIDANLTKGGDQSFQFVGSGAFTSGGQGSITVTQVAGNTYINIDNGNGGTAEMVIKLAGLIAVSSGDFIL
jgi:Ca2+-binding RTX toxin-like protein